MQLLKKTTEHYRALATNTQKPENSLHSVSAVPEKVMPQTAQSIIACETVNSYIPKTNMQIDKDTFLNTLLDGHRKFSERRKETTTGDEFDDKNLETVCRILGRMIAYELQTEE